MAAMAIHLILANHPLSALRHADMPSAFCDDPASPTEDPEHKPSGNSLTLPLGRR